MLWTAAESDPEMVVFLLSKGATVDLRARANDWPSQMTSEPRVQCRPTGELTALLYAAREGCRACIEGLPRGGANIDLQNPDGMTPLMMAIDNAHYEAALYLLQQGANPHTWDWWGRTVLYVVVNMRGGPDSHPGPREPASLELVHALLKTGVDANTQLNMLQPSRNGVLFFAVQSGRAAVVRFLLGHGASVNARGDSGDALLNAARNNAEVTNMLRTPISRGIAPVTR